MKCSYVELAEPSHVFAVLRAVVTAALFRLVSFATSLALTEVEKFTPLALPCQFLIVVIALLIIFLAVSRASRVASFDLASAILNS